MQKKNSYIKKAKKKHTWEEAKASDSNNAKHQD